MSKPNEPHLEFHCPQCHARVKVPPSLAGTRSDCPFCGKSIIVPGTPDGPSSDFENLLELNDLDEDDTPSDSGTETEADTSRRDGPDDSNTANAGAPDPAHELRPLGTEADDPGLETAPAEAQSPLAEDGRSSQETENDSTDDLGELLSPPAASKPTESTSKRPKDPFEHDADAPLKIEGISKPDNVFSVVCPICASLVYATNGEIGMKKKCPDCFTAVEITKPRESPPTPAHGLATFPDSTSDGESYDVAPAVDVPYIDTRIEEDADDILMIDEDQIRNNTSEQSFSGTPASQHEAEADEYSLAPLDDGPDSRADVGALNIEPEDLQALRGAPDKPAETPILVEPIDEEAEEQVDSPADTTPQHRAPRSRETSEREVDSKSADRGESSSPGRSESTPTADSTSTTDDSAEIAGNPPGATLGASSAPTSDGTSGPTSAATLELSLGPGSEEDLPNALFAIRPWARGLFNRMKEPFVLFRAVLAGVALASGMWLLDLSSSIQGSDIPQHEKFIGIVWGGFGVLILLPTVAFLFYYFNCIVNFTAFDVDEEQQWPDFALDAWGGAILNIATTVFAAAVPGFIFGLMLYGMTRSSFAMAMLVLVCIMAFAPIGIASAYYNERFFQVVSRDILKTFNPLRNRWFRLYLVSGLLFLSLAAVYGILHIDFFPVTLIGAFALVALLTFYAFVLGDHIRHVVGFLMENRDQTTSGN